MPYCSQCGCKLDDDDLFCSHCGTPVKSIAEESVDWGGFPARHAVPPNTGVRVAESPQAGRTSVAVAERPAPTARQGEERAIHKCPRCGERLDWDDGVCPSCGWELRDRAPSRTSRAFSERLYDFQLRYSEAVIKSNSSDPEVAAIAKRTELDLIRVFVIPNTAEDLTEFAVLASSNVADDDSDLSDAWMSKLTQTREKAEILFPNSAQSERISSLYDKSVSERDKRKKSAVWKRRSSRLESVVKGEDFVLITMAVIIFGGMMLTGLYSGLNDYPASLGMGILTALGIYVLAIAVYVLLA